MQRIAVAREFDWPEQALLDALDIGMREANLGDIRDYFRRRTAHHDSVGRSREIEAFMRRVSDSVGRVAGETGGDTLSEVQRGPRVFISYAHEGSGLGSWWNKSVLYFADALGEHQLEVDLDQYARAIERDWSQWGPEAIERADYVLCLASERYLKEWRVDLETDHGSHRRRGAASDEARTIRAARLDRKVKVMFVVLPGKSVDHIPTSMEGLHWEMVEDISKDGWSLSPS